MYGGGSNHGIVLVEYNNKNGTICDDYLSNGDSITPRKLCEFLGKKGPAVWYSEKERYFFEMKSNYCFKKCF